MKGQSIGQGVLFLTVFGALAQVLGFGYRVIMSRMVGAEVMGLFQLVMSAYGVIQSLTMIGLTAALSNLTARELAQGNTLGAAQIRGTCLRVFFILLLPVGLITVLGSDAISVYLLGDARTQLGLMLLIPCAALTGIENLHKNIFYGAGKPKGPAVAEVVEQLVRAAAVLGLLYLFLPQYPERVVGLIVLGMVLCEVVSALTLLGMYRYYRAKQRLTGPGESKGQRWHQITAIAIPVGVNALTGTLLGAANSALLPQKLLEGGMDRAQAMSQLGVVTGMTLPMLAVPTVFLGAINLMLMPKLAAASALGQRGEVGKLTAEGMKVVSRLAFPVMTMMVVLGKDFGLALFKREDVGNFLLPLAGATLMSCLCSVLIGVLNSIGKQSLVASISILGGVVQLICTLLLAALPGVGIRGYVFGMVLAFVLEVGAYLFFVEKHTGTKTDWFSWFLAPALASSLAGATSNLLIGCLKGAGCIVPVADGAGVVLALIQYMTALYVLSGGREE